MRATAVPFFFVTLLLPPRLTGAYTSAAASTVSPPPPVPNLAPSPPQPPVEYPPPPPTDAKAISTSPPQQPESPSKLALNGAMTEKREVLALSLVLRGNVADFDEPAFIAAFAAQLNVSASSVMLTIRPASIEVTAAIAAPAEARAKQAMLAQMEALVAAPDLGSRALKVAVNAVSEAPHAILVPVVASPAAEPHGTTQHQPGRVFDRVHLSLFGVGLGGLAIVVAMTLCAVCREPLSTKGERSRLKR